MTTPQRVIREQVEIVEDAGGDPDVTTRAILAALDRAGYIIIERSARGAGTPSPDANRLRRAGRQG